MVSCVTILRGKTPNACLTEWPGLSQNEAECRVAIKRNMCPCCQSHNANPSLNVFCRHSNWCSLTFNYFNLKKGTEHLREPHFTCSRKSIFFFHLALGFFSFYDLFLLRYGKIGNKKRAACLAALLQNELNGDVARFTSDIKPVLQQIRMLTGLNVSGKKRNIAIQLV